MEDTWDWVQEELKKIQDDLPVADPEMTQVVDAISVADFWKRRYDEERLLWERKLETREGEKKALQDKARAHESTLKELDWKLKELERRWEREKELLEDRVRTKELEATFEKTKFGWEKRIEALEEENRQLKVQMGLAPGTAAGGVMASPLVERTLREKDEQVRRFEQDSRARLEKLEAEKAEVARILAEKEKTFAAERDGWQKLEKEITQMSGQMSGQLGALKTREEEHFVILEDLARGFAHRVRNHLGIISGTIQLSLANFSLDPSLAEQLRIVDQTVQDMMGSIEDFLSLARIPEMRLEPQSVDALLAAAAQAAAVRCAAQKVTVRHVPAAGLPPLAVDQRLLSDALRRLLDNALDAMPQGGTLTLSAAQDAARGTVVLTVADTGEGIADAHLKKVFQPYFTTRKDRKGLGLTVAKRVADLHRGTLALTSTRGAGTSVSITLFSTPPGA